MKPNETKNTKNGLRTMFAVLAMSLMIGSAGATEDMTGRDGTGVGNGGNDARAEYIEKLKRDLGVADAINGTAPELSAWCARVSSILSRELKRARLAVQQERFDNAFQILKDSLAAASQSIHVDAELGGPMTKTLVDRGLLIAQALEETIGGNRYELVSKINFVFGYVEFIIEMEGALDRPWYIPYRYSYNRCYHNCPSEFSFADFQRAYLDYSGRQLKFVAEALTDVVHVRGGRPEARPVGDARVFLKAAELTSAFVADDVSKNLFAYAHSCTVAELSRLSADLRDFNTLGDRSVYPSSRIAVATAYEEMMIAARRLAGNPESCR